VLCGVVGSGNLEVLMQAGGDHTYCCVDIHTSVRDFDQIWESVITSFAAAHQLGGTHITINDMGATPAVVNLRLAQAFAQYNGVTQ